MDSQITLQNIVGEYALQGVPEMAAGFKFNKDSSFQFFYIYGASDRKAEGKFEISANKIILQGTKPVGKDFKLLQKKRLGNGFTIQIQFENKMFIRNVVCFFYGSNGTITQETNQDGIATANIETCNKIELIHSYFPDVPTVLDLQDNENNFFELTLNQSLEDVVFDQHIIEKDGNTLICNNIYLFGQNQVRFVKQ